MWRLHAPDEIKVLIWLIFHNCLPTNKLLFKRNIISDPLCSRCSYIGDREEYTLFKRLCFCQTSLGFFGNHELSWLLGSRHHHMDHKSCNKWRICYFPCRIVVYMEAARYYNYSGDVWLLRQISYLAADFHAARETTDFSGLIRNGDGRCQCVSQFLQVTVQTFFQNYCPLNMVLLVAWNQGYKISFCNSDFLEELRLVYDDLLSFIVLEQLLWTSKIFQSGGFLSIR